MMVLTLAGCGRENGPENMKDTGGRIQFTIPKLFQASVGTKTTEVTSLDEFYVGCVTGTLGTAEVEEWSSTFTSDGEQTPTYASDRFWPADDAGYKFFASNAVLTKAETGYTVSVDNTTDVVCAVLPDPVFGTRNNLSFEHVLARLGEVTVSAAPHYTVTDVSISITPNTGGVYNLLTGNGHTDGTGWSSLVKGAETAIASSSPGTLENDLWLVPGTYTLMAGWTAEWEDYSKTFERYTADVTLRSGAVNSISVTLGGDSTPGEKFSISISAFSAEEPLELSMDDMSQAPYTFGGLMVAPCNAMYQNNQIVIPHDDWNHSSYADVHGLNNGSYYFTFLEAGMMFDSRGLGFSSSSGNIRNDRAVSYNGYDDWRIPTRAEWYTLTKGTSPGTAREGSVVNGTPGVKYAFIFLPAVAHGPGTDTYGLLLFPDGETITGETLLAASINGGGMSQRTTLTNAQLNVYLEQGCVFLPGTGHYVNNGSRWENGGVMTGFYLTADVYDQMERYYINVWNENFNLDMRSRIESNLDNCDVLRLVRTAQ